MKPKLPRALLWTDKTSMEEFLREPINERLYDFYLELKSMTTHVVDEKRPLKLFNEIYYQLTRVEYEKELDFDLDKYTQDIKANMGMLHSSIFVFIMIIAFLRLRQNNTNATRLFKKALMAKCFSFGHEKTMSRLNEMMLVNRKTTYKVDLTPHPRDVKDLDGELLRWDEITNNFDSSSIKEVLNLWSTNEEKIEVLHLIEDAYIRIRRRVARRFGERVHYAPPTLDNDFFQDIYSELGDKKDSQDYAAEELLPPSPTYAELEEENYNLKKKIAHLESDNERLRSERNPLRTRKNRDRAFTLKMIVDYCKKHLNLDKASTIVAMLNKFLRDAKDYTQEECDLVDSIEIEYLNRKYGDTIMGDKNEFNDNSGLNQIALPPGMSVQEAMRLLQNKCKDNGEER